jgi:hypothetical protein
VLWKELSLTAGVVHAGLDAVQLLPRRCRREEPAELHRRSMRLLPKGRMLYLVRDTAQAVTFWGMQEPDLSLMLFAGPLLQVPGQTAQG